MIKLIKITSDDHKKFTAVDKIEMEIHDESTLPEVLQAFKDFLLACGWGINGNIIVEETTNEDIDSSST